MDPELNFAQEVELHLPVRAAKVLVKDLAATVQRRAQPPSTSAAAVTAGAPSEVERRLARRESR